MIPELRQEFNARFTEQRYRSFLERLDYRCRTAIPFRVCETPCFIPRELQRVCEEAAIELTIQAHDPAYLERSDSTLRPEYTVNGQPDRSLFMTVDFAMTEGLDGSFTPKLIEMQGFPSLMGFQMAYTELAMEHWHLPSALACYNGGHTRNQILEILRHAIVADEARENVVLMEVDPWNQKTSCDFTMMREMLGIQVVDIRALKKIGRKLHYERDGMMIPINRIYNRAIVDEIERRKIELPFGWHDDLDVAWAGHPNWYFRISKFTLPFLDHPTVPRSIFLDRMVEIPANLDDYVLKPLYSFAGVGVIVGPTETDIMSIPAEQRGNYLLQERVIYAEAIQTPQGGTKVELRFMLIWLPDENRPRPIIGLSRMGRGKLMGVDFNSEQRWIGAGCNFYEPT